MAWDLSWMSDNVRGKQFEKLFGRGNDAPDGYYDRITEQEFIAAVTGEEYRAIDHRQVRTFSRSLLDLLGLDATPKYELVLMVLFAKLDRTAFGMVSHPTSRAKRYFRFCKCRHVFASTTIGNCLTRYQCSVPDCGYSYEQDSSG